MKLDNLHFSTNTIDGYNCPFNFIVSAREDGKTTAILLKAKQIFKKTGRPTILIRRMQADITELYINSIERVLNKFKAEDEKPIHLTYKKSAIDEGLVQLYNNDAVMFVIIALTTPLQRTKSLFIENPAFFFFEEFVVNQRIGEKYVTAEVERFREIYNTFYREGETMPRCYWCGNPYSFYNCWFEAYGIDTKELIREKIIRKGNVCVQYHPLNPKLLEIIREKNPLFDECQNNAYIRYALLGEAVNDSNIKIMDKQPPNFSLSMVLYKEGKYMGIFQNNDILDFDLRYYVGYCDKVSAKRNVYTFDFGDLIENVTLFDAAEKKKFSRFKAAIRKKAVAFQNLECNYFIEEIYTSL